MECKKYKTETEHWITILVDKSDDKNVITSKSALLNKCEECIESETCRTVLQLIKIFNS